MSPFPVSARHAPKHPKKMNKIKGIDFSKKFKSPVEKYNERKEQDVLRSEVLEDFTDEIIDLFYSLKKEKASFADLGIDLDEVYKEIFEQAENFKKYQGTR